MAELPDEWQLNGFDDEAAQWWLDNEFDCKSAIEWRDSTWHSFDPASARLWVDAGVGVEEATEWERAIEETEFDTRDAITMHRAGKFPEDAEREGGGLDAAFERARGRASEESEDTD